MAVNLARNVEVAAWSVGVALLCGYSGARLWLAQASDDGVATFEAARQEHLAQTGQEHLAQTGHASAAKPGVVAPDTSLWSDERVSEYRKAITDAGAPAAVLKIPSLRLVVPVFDGTSELNLNRGAGRIEGTAAIGETGNLGLAAHRDGFFRVLKDVRVGDAIHLEQIDAAYTYRVVSTKIVLPSDVSVLHDTDAMTLTLVTCYPFYFVGSAPKRFIVRADLVRDAAQSQ